VDLCPDIRIDARPAAGVRQRARRIRIKVARGRKRLTCTHSARAHISPDRSASSQPAGCAGHRSEFGPAQTVSRHPLSFSAMRSEDRLPCHQGAHRAAAFSRQRPLRLHQGNAHRPPGDGLNGTESACSCAHATKRGSPALMLPVSAALRRGPVGPPVETDTADGGTQQ
jgi:hypothetical protein